MALMRTVARLATSALAVSLALAACARQGDGNGGSNGGGAEDNKLFVYNWSDYIADGVLVDFKKETGIDVTYDFFDSNELLQSKLLQGNTGYDVVVPSASFLEREVKAGSLQKLDKSLLPNLKNLDPALMQRVARHDPGNEHGIVYLWGTSGVGYNEEKIRAALADAPVDSFAMFYDPAIVAKFKDCGVALLDAPSEVVGTVLLYLGKDANSENLDDLAAVEKVLLSIRPYVRYVNSSKYIEDLANGEICLALGWNGDVFQARDRARDAGKTFTIRYHIPKQGAIQFFDMLAVPSDAKHVKNAHRFIDFLMRPDVAARNSNFKRYATINSAAWPQLVPEVKTNPGIYPPAEVQTRLVPDLAKSAVYTRQLIRTWTRFKTGK